MTKIFGKYQVVRRLAVGGMAEVFLATTVGPGGIVKPVAIKRILPHLTEDADFLNMFFDEARILARLSHPNIVQILDLGTIGNNHMLVMEFVHGASMEKLLKVCARRKCCLPLEYGVKIIGYVCEALEYAHNFTRNDGTPLALIHRDVSPGNIMVSFDGVVKVLDFGVAKAVGNITKTRPSFLKGKAAYMSPEQIAQVSEIDRRADIFSLGVCLYEFITNGKRPFGGNSELEVMMAIVQKPTPDPRVEDPNIPQELVQILFKALEKDRERRYQSAREMRADLETFLFSRKVLVDQVTLANFLRDLTPKRKGAASAPPEKGAVLPVAPVSEPEPEEQARSADGFAPDSPPAMASLSPPVAWTPPPASPPVVQAQTPPTSPATPMRPPSGIRPVAFGLGTLEEEGAPPKGRSQPLLAGVLIALLLLGGGAFALVYFLGGEDGKKEAPKTAARPRAEQEPPAPSPNLDAGQASVAQVPDAGSTPQTQADAGNAQAIEPRVEANGLTPGEVKVPEKGVKKKPVLAGVVPGHHLHRQPIPKPVAAIAPEPSPAEPVHSKIEPPSAEQPRPEGGTVAEVPKPPPPVAPLEPVNPPPAELVATTAALPPTYQPPEVLNKRRIVGGDPPYPAIARQAHREATILVRVFISPKGEVEEIRFLKSEPAFEDTVRRTLKTWKFSPLLINGRPVGTYTVYKFMFRLDE